VWSTEVDEEEGCDSCSKVSSFSTPDPTDGFNFTESFRGPNPSVINVLLTPTFYTNHLKDTELAGYRVHMMSVDKGSTTNLRDALKLDP
jgi:hypothetical protein